MPARPPHPRTRGSRAREAAAAPAPDPARLRAAIERALRRDEPQGDVLPMLEHLERIARDDDDRRFADRRLAELLLEAEPWRAAVHLRRLLADRGGRDDDAHWALMGLAQALLGNHRFAAKAYRRALSIDPGNPWYAHNLGHLLDIGLGRPLEALRHLRLAHDRDDATPIACSYAHALWRVGRLDEARRVLRPHVRRNGRDPDVIALAAQLDRATGAERDRAADRPRARRPRRKRGDAQ